MWCGGNVYLNGARAWRHEQGALVDGAHTVRVELAERGGRPVLDTDLYAVLGGYTAAPVDTAVLGRAFQPDQPFENPDGTPIAFNSDYFGAHRGPRVLPGPFADAAATEKPLF